MQQGLEECRHDPCIESPDAIPIEGEESVEMFSAEVRCRILSVYYHM